MKQESSGANAPFGLNFIGSGLPAAEVTEPLLDGDVALRTVVVAPPGTGKTTIVPPTVANRVATQGRGGKVVVTQPRRMAARAAARRLAQLSGTRVGDVVGYTVRGDQQTSQSTLVEFVTTGVLLRRLLRDPEATGIAAIILDEVHERQLDTDLTFAMVQQLGQLRDEPLDIVVMSATLDAQLWADLLASEQEKPAEILSVDAVTHPLREQWAPLPGHQRSLDARGVTETFLTHVAHTVVATLEREPNGDILVFLPGAREIQRMQQRLAQQLSAVSVEVLPLLGSTPAEEQDRILQPPTIQQPRRIVLATNVAESALTVPGVRIVIDTGLDRQSRLDTVRGVAGLVTVGAAKSSMVQRGGRAAREAPGLVVRCMSEAEFAARPAHRPAEVRTTDLTQAVLDLACWGSADGAGMALPEALPHRSYQTAVETLLQLGALDDDVRVTELGRKLANLPVDPRLGRALYDGADFAGAQLVAEIVATLASDQRAPGADLSVLHRQLRSQRPQRWRNDVSRLRRVLPSATDDPLPDLLHVGLITALAYPGQIARRRGAEAGQESEYLLASGTAASLPRDSSLQGCQWLAIAELALVGDRTIIRSAAELDQDRAELAAGPLVTTRTEAKFVDGKVSARSVHRLGAIELSSTPIKPTAAHTRSAVAAEIQDRGILAFFEVDTKAQRFANFQALRGRLGVLHRVLGPPWPAMTDTALTKRLDDWLAPEIEQLAGGTPHKHIDLTSALRRLLPWPEASRFEDLTPEQLQVPSGSHIRLDWPAPEEHTDDEVASPILAVKLQECFGWTGSPTVVQGKVPVVLHLLSPAQRPLAITRDLSNFWINVYPQVRAENRGRYVKHPWPEDPLTAVATAKTNRALRKSQES